jgi:DNA-directed RNA polymerase specialized sigma24 family protein
MGRVVGRAQARREYLEAIDQLDEADRRLRAQLARARRLRSICRRHVTGGGTAATLKALLDVQVARNQLDGALGEILSARQRAQNAIFRLAATEGMNAAEIARTWGVSRQLVSRILNHTKQPRKVGGPGSRVGS